MIAAGLTAWILPRAYGRLIVYLPHAKEVIHRRNVSEKQHELTTTRWADERPLYVFAGDSHIEQGAWYELFGGAYAVRNVGLSQATIEDVTSLILSLPKQETKAVVLMCGINNMGRGDQLQNCLVGYERLIAACRALRPAKTLVLGVMPVRQSSLDRKAERLNANVKAFNLGLKSLCDREHCTFIDLSDTLRASDAGLRGQFTADGLHLNSVGYRAIRDHLRPYLNENLTQAQ